MGYASYIGRIGALAVALGLGSAIATTPGVALAAPSDSETTSSTQESSTDDADASTTEQDQGSEPAEAAAVEEDEEAVDDEDDESPPAVDEETSPDTDDAEDSVAGKTTDHDGVAGLADGSDGRDVAPANPSDEDEAPAAAEQFVQTRKQTQASDVDVSDVAAQRVSTFSNSTAITSVGAPPVAVVPAPPPSLEDILEEPHTHFVGLAAHVVDAVLETLLAPLGPGTPAQSPLLWTMLAFVRDEFRRIFSPHLLPQPPTPSLVDDPNLIVNPGAELGDPSLSGYSSVTLPGWAVTGTPTAIKYGTLRRFPVPTPSPGPVLPDLLAFPDHDGPIATPEGSGQQFFGGGPVADSTLTQVVDLTGAADAIDTRVGGVDFELSGDLGGFLIDPSRTTVTVNFMNDSGATLGSAALRPVTAWDRLFATGFLRRSVAGQVPVGTRRAEVVVTMDDRNPVLGNYNNAYADNLSFKVDVDGLSPATLEPPTSNVGPLDHVFMVYLENKGVSQIVGSPNAPYLNSLIDTYGYASSYYGLTHPSDPNYYPIVGGSDFGFNYNCPSNCFPVGTPNLVDNIEATPDLTWAGYAEGGGGYTTPTDRLPFLAFTDFYNDPDRVAAHLFDISEMAGDLEVPDDAPNYVWFAANDETNMEGPTDVPFGILHWALGFLNPRHQYNVAAGDEWLRGPIETIMNSPTWQDPNHKSAIFVTFDEDYNNITTGVGNEGNHIVMIVIPNEAAIEAGMVEGPFVAGGRYDHYSLLRTIEEALGLTPLTNNDRYAVPMNEFWE